MFDRKPMTTGEMVFTGVTLAATFGFMAWVINKTTRVSAESMRRRDEHLDRTEKLVADLKALHERGLGLDLADLSKGHTLRVIRDMDED